MYDISIIIAANKRATLWLLFRHQTRNSNLSRRVTDQGVEYYRSKGDISRRCLREWLRQAGLGAWPKSTGHFELATSRLRTAPTESTYEWPAVYFTCPLFRERPRRSRCDKSRSEGNRKLALYQDARSTNRANFPAVDNGVWEVKRMAVGSTVEEWIVLELSAIENYDWPNKTSMVKNYETNGILILKILIANKKFCIKKLQKNCKEERFITWYNK